MGADGFKMLPVFFCEKLNTSNLKPNNRTMAKNKLALANGN
jgi:hypothetical protein